MLDSVETMLGGYYPCKLCITSYSDSVWRLTITSMNTVDYIVGSNSAVLCNNCVLEIKGTADHVSGDQITKKRVLEIIDLYPQIFGDNHICPGCAGTGIIRRRKVRTRI